MDDEYQRLITQLQRLHAQGHAAHERFLEAQAQHDVETMRLLNAEHETSALEARDLVTQLRAVVDGHRALFDRS